MCLLRKDVTLLVVTGIHRIYREHFRYPCHEINSILSHLSSYLVVSFGIYIKQPLVNQQDDPTRWWDKYDKMLLISGLNPPPAVQTYIALSISLFISVVVVGVVSGNFLLNILRRIVYSANISFHAAAASREGAISSITGFSST